MQGSCSPVRSHNFVICKILALLKQKRLWEIYAMLCLGRGVDSVEGIGVYMPAMVGNKMCCSQQFSLAAQGARGEQTLLFGDETPGAIMAYLRKTKSPHNWNKLDWN